jgi:hypothetical protein
MKKISLFFVILLAGVTFLTSCTKDTTPPTINFLGGAGYTSTDATIDAGTDVKIGITAQSGTAKLETLEIVAIHNNTPVPVHTETIDAASSESFTKDYTITIDEIGETKLNFTITDKDGETATVSLTITANQVDDVTTYTQKILGSYDNSTYGSSFASADGTVYKMADAKANSSKIDWLYFYGVSNQATLASPNDADAATIFDGTNGLQTWATLNATGFRKVTEGIVWDNVTTSANIAAIATATTETKANLLQVGSIVAFKTAGNKLGLIKITEITGTGAGTITYDVKVQK